MKKYSLEKFKERRKNRKVIKFTIITLIAIIILVFIALYMANKSFNSFIDTYILKKRISENDANSLTIDTDNLSLIYAYDKSLVVYSDGSINFYNTDAKQTGNIEMTLSKPIADSEDKYLALADYGLQKVCLIKSNSLVWQKDIEGKISKVSVNKQGYVAVSVTGTTYESIVMLFNENGDLLFSKYLSTYVIDVDISDDSKYIAIAEVDNSTILPVTKIEMVSVGLASTSSENATINDIRDAFDYAYKGYVKDFNKHLHSVYEPLIRDINSDLGFCKGITVYRDKSRDKQVLETGSKNSSKQVPDVCTINSSVNNINSIENYINIPPKFNTIESVSNTTNSIRKRGDSLRGYTERIKIGCGELYVTVNFDDDGVREIFTTNGKSGGCHSQSEATCRMVSTALKYNIPTDVIIKQLKGIRCPSSIKNSGGCSLSCPDAIARCMEKCIGYEKNKKTDSYSEYYQQQFTKYYDEAIVNLTNIETLDSSKCPECGSPLEFEGGCQVCRSCGYSKCH